MVEKRTMKWLVIGAVLVALVLPSAAEASIPSYQDRWYAKQWARDWWASKNWRYGNGRPNCYGVRFRWRGWRYFPYKRRTLAYVPNANDCIIVFNKNARWGRVPERGRQITELGEAWWRFCATTFHEWGHLRGMPYNWRNPPTHSWNPNNVVAHSEMLNTRAWWWPYFPGCRYEGDGVEWE